MTNTRSELAALSITDASKKLAAKEISAVELARACAAEIELHNPSLNAYLEVFADIDEQATVADLRRASGESGALLGIPLAMKDNILIEGRRASAASKMLEHYTATYDATVSRKLKDAGAIFLGRTNMDEFALGGSTENSAFGVTKNPHDEARVAGGTSGGSAAAVAANMALGALGTDTGGSVRNPASFCGIVGLKPTYGAVSRFGLIAAVSSFDQAGPMTKTVVDAELLFNTVRGQDALDSTSIAADLYPKHEKKNIIGVPLHSFEGALSDDMRAAFNAAIEKLKQQGFAIRYDIEFPSAAAALSAYYIINFAEVSTNLARFDGVRYGLLQRGETLFDDYATSRALGFGPESRRRIMLGTYVLSAGYYDAYYGKANLVRASLRREFEAAFSEVDAVLTPTMPTPAWSIGEKSDPLAAYLADIFTVTANVTGNPAISIPMGTVEREGKSLPVGMQLTAMHGDEATLFSIGKAFESTQ